MGLPIAAIGGITAENVDEIKGCGYRGIAVVSAIFAEDDVKSAAAHLRRKAEEGIGL
jgi:thiamine monophosphate synthase